MTNSKSIFVPILVLCLIFSSIFIPSSPLNNELLADSYVNIPDTNLKRVLNNTLNGLDGGTRSPEDDILHSELNKINKINAYDEDIISLKGLEMCVNLTDVNLNDNYIYDITPLTSLSNLKKLKLNLNFIKNIPDISKMLNLEYLNISFNYISDFTPCLKGPNLKEINAKNQEINGPVITMDIYQKNTVTKAFKGQFHNNLYYDFAGMNGCEYDRKTDMINILNEEMENVDEIIYDFNFAGYIRNNENLINANIGWTVFHDLVIPKSRVNIVNKDQNKIPVGTLKSYSSEVLPNFNNNYKYIWTTSNPNIASVSQDGTVKAVNEGIATITVSTSDNKVMPFSFNVTVYQDFDRFIKLFSNSRIYLVKKTKYKPMFAAYDKNKNRVSTNINWTSSNKKIATVNKKGEINTKKNGKTIITGTTLSGKQIQFKITVVKKKKKLDKNYNFQLPGRITIGKTIFFSQEYWPRKATNPKIKIWSSNQNILSVSKEGKITGVRPGTATVYIKNGKKVIKKKMAVKKSLVTFDIEP